MRSDKDVKLRFFFENLNFPAKKIDLGTGVGDGDRHREKMTYRQTTQDTGSMGGFSGPVCLTRHMTEMRKTAGKKFFAGW